MPKLKSLVEGVRDSAFEVLGQTPNDTWLSISIEWVNGDSRATLNNLGSGCINLALRAHTNSSNGVSSAVEYDVELRDDTPSQARKRFSSEWTLPEAGGNNDQIQGDDAVGQLSSEIGRFIDPITAQNVKVNIASVASVSGAR